MTASYYEFKVSIGPPYHPHWHPYFFDWSVLDYATAAPSFLEGTVSVSVGEFDTTIVSAMGPSYPLVGGFWVGPNGNGEGWEYVEYLSVAGNNFNTCIRESSTEREHNGIHTAGAPLKFWWELDGNNGVLQFNEKLDNNWATVSWQASIGGILVPRVALRNNHLALVETRQSPTDPWRIELVGWLASPKVSDDAGMLGRWTASIVSSATMAQRHEVGGVSAGELDIAQHGAASGSESLAKAYKERSSGDFTVAAPNLTHSSMIDADDSTLFIAEQYVGTENWLTANGDPHWRTDVKYPAELGNNPENQTHFLITGIYLQRPTGYNSEGYRWIELTAVAVSDGTTSIQDCTIYTGDPANYALADIGESDVEPGQKIIICENEDLFREENPVSAIKTIWEMNAQNISGNTNFWNDIDVAGDVIAFKQLHGSQKWMHGVAWGNSDGVSNDPTGSDDDEFYWHVGGTQPLADSATDPKPPAPAPGEAIRYLFGDANGGGDSTNAWDYWDTSTVVSPGYTIGNYDEGDSSRNQGQIVPVYVIFDIPVLPLVLKDDLAASSTVGEKIYINDASGPNTGGLDDSGVIQIADEQIQYSSKADDGVIVQARGYNGTTATAHNAGDSVLFVENGIATSAPPIKSVGWDRNNDPYPKNFWLYTTTDPNAATLSEDRHVYDWDYIVGVSNHASQTWTYTFSPSVRVRRVMIVFEYMSVDPARPRINEFHAIVDLSKYTAGEFLTANENAGDIAALVLENAGIPATAITDTSTGDPIDNSTTAAERGWAVAADMADYAKLRIVVGRDSKIAISDDAYWAALSFTPVNSWDRDNVSAVDVAYGAGEIINQVRLAWQTADGTSGEEVYPASADDEGVVMEVGPMIYPSATVAQAAAKKMYYSARYPYTIVVNCAEEQPAATAGEIDQLDWQLHADDTEMSRLFVVENAAHEIRGNMWSTVLSGTQIDRESEG